MSGWIRVSFVQRSRPRNSEQGVTPVVACGVVRYVNRKFSSWCCEVCPSCFSAFIACLKVLTNLSASPFEAG